jgi:hypothetical protein
LYTILTHASLSNSARSLAYELQNRTGKQWSVNFGEERISKAPDIRWGNSSFMGIGGVDTIYNNPKLLQIAGNKLSFSNEIKKNNLPVIQFHRGVPERFPVVVRKTLTGSSGNGIVICTNYEQFKEYENYYWSYWYNFPFELGVHVFNGRIMKIFKKMKGDETPEERFPIRNLSRGYRFVRVKEDNFPKLIPTVKELFEKFPISFGRLDIGWDDEGKLYRIIEFNSAPGISSNQDTLNSYVSSFCQIFG